MSRANIPTVGNPLRFFTILLLFILLNGCASLSHIDRAQDEFNKGAEIENASLLNQSISLVTPPRPADYYYKRAYFEINQALEKEAKLKKLEIYLNAFTLKALCEWKLNNPDEAKKTAKIAIDYLQEKDMSADDIPRDFAVLHAMSALTGIEAANELQADFFSADSIKSEAGIAEYKKLIHKEAGFAGNIEKNLEELESISRQIAQKHDVQTYLLLSKLAALKVWDDALEALFGVMEMNNENNEWYHNEEKALAAKIKTYGKQLKNRIGKKHSVYSHWNRMLAFPND